MATHLYFVRHGESNSNADGVSRGPASILTERGEREAELVAERIARIGVDAIVASPYIRTRATAKPISEKLGLPVEENELLTEWRTPSSHVNRSRKDPDIREERTAILGQFGITDYVHSDEETFTDFKSRALAAMESLRAHPADRLCVVTHGIFLRMLFLAWLKGEEFDGHDFARTWRMVVNNTGVTYVRWSDGEGEWDHGWHIVSWNDSAHLG